MLGSPCRSVTRCNPMTSRLRFSSRCSLYSRWPRAAARSGTPGERASASTDSTALLRATFGNLDKMKSAEVDLKLEIKPRGSGAAQGPVSARLHGPFASQGANKLPKFAFTAELAVRRPDLQRGRDVDRQEGLRLTDGHAVRGVRPRDEAVRRDLRAVAEEQQGQGQRWARARQPRHRLHEVAARRPQRGRRQGRRRGHDQDQRQGRHQAGRRRSGQDHREGRDVERARRGRQGPAEAHAAAEAGLDRRDQGADRHGLHRRRGQDPAPADRQRGPQARPRRSTPRSCSTSPSPRSARSRRSPPRTTRSRSASC